MWLEFDSSLYEKRTRKRDELIIRQWEATKKNGSWNTPVEGILDDIHDEAAAQYDRWNIQMVPFYHSCTYLSLWFAFLSYTIIFQKREKTNECTYRKENKLCDDDCRVLLKFVQTARDALSSFSCSCIYEESAIENDKKKRVIEETYMHL